MSKKSLNKGGKFAMLKIKDILRKVFVFGGFSILGLLIWVIIGAVNEAPVVAGASWFELSLGLFTVWMVAANVSEMLLGKSSLHNFIDMITIIIAIVITIAFLNFSISFDSLKIAILSMKAPVAVTIGLALFIAIGNELIAGLINKQSN